MKGLVTGFIVFVALLQNGHTTRYVQDAGFVYPQSAETGSSPEYVTRSSNANQFILTRSSQEFIPTRSPQQFIPTRSSQEFIPTRSPQQFIPTRSPAQVAPTRSAAQFAPTRFHSSNLVELVNRFSWNLFHNSKLPIVTNNLILSPVAVQLMLSVLEKGSAGETKTQLQSVIGEFNSEDLINLVLGRQNSKAQIELANGMFVDAAENLNQSFVNEAKRINVDVKPVQFSRGEVTKDLINKWASDATHGLVPKLLSDSYDVRELQMVLASAIYFHNTWKYKFEPVPPMPFYTENGASRQVQFMELQEELVWQEIIVDHGIAGSLIEIPYANDSYSMVILLPDKQYSLDTFIRSMNSDHFIGVSSTILSKDPKYVTLKMPKFEASSRFSVVNSLLQLGLVDLFTINSKLPYIGLSEYPKISDILQQAVLKVDENGTTAAAAASSILIPLSADSADQRTIVVDRPFLAIIFDRANRVPLFISKIYKP